MWLDSEAQHFIREVNYAHYESADACVKSFRKYMEGAKESIDFDEAYINNGNYTPMKYEEFDERVRYYENILRNYWLEVLG